MYIYVLKKKKKKHEMYLDYIGTCCWYMDSNLRLNPKARQQHTLLIGLVKSI